ncbi:hypothetical protein GCM10011344_44520 [Dokdonia pacifica]|uniref:Uncharacterized protein n=1 Tax=Dokdonia pacifica TaxID=1627892 RepID=A0A239CNX1_9FLAO|nr:hypothetical protein [Dokdonia pacifica]GGG38696.1 hypothetical protein GCM10011344_44520 [Dokdonia pacifica]SNS21184.1 hypothetical protein SAMN06265376_10882 [Dokdonia pacifica]
MHDFKNRKIQELYNYLVDDFDWNDFTYGQSYVLESFGKHIDKLKDEDWNYFEKNIDLWASEVLHRLAIVIAEYNSKNLNYVLQKRVYCLALINCWDKETCDLCTNLSAELGLVIDLDIEILERVIERLEQLLNHYNVVANYQAEEHTKRTIEFVKKKLTLTIEKTKANKV